MNVLRMALVPLGVAAAVLALGLSGCAPASRSGAGGGLATQPGATTPASSPSTHPQGKFDGIPKHCPSSADVTLALHLQVPVLQENNISGTLVCSYHGASASDPNMQVGFTTAPAGMTPADYKKAEQSSLPTAQFVPGVGDGAFYYTSATLPSEMKFISNGVSCVVDTFNFAADKSHMITLADSILEG
jgi:hypothetical protein